MPIVNHIRAILPTFTLEFCFTHRKYFYTAFLRKAAGRENSCQSYLALHTEFLNPKLDEQEISLKFLKPKLDEQ